MFQIKITYPKPLYLGDVATHTGDKEICFISGILSYAPINVMPAGGGRQGRQGMHGVGI